MIEPPTSPLPPASQPDELSAGDMLRQLREAAGEDIATLARALKVPAHKLQALEADDHDIFPDVVVMRGIAASICRHFKAKPAPVLALLPDFAPTRLMTDADLNEAFTDDRQPRFDPHGKVARFKLGPMGIVIGLLLLAAAAIAFLPPWEKGSFREEQQAAWQQPADTQRSSTTVSTVVEPIAATVPQEPAQTAVNEPSQPAQPPESQPTQPSVPPPSVVGTEAAAQAAEPATATLLLRANATSWVQIRNADGVSLVQRLLQAGESVTAPGQPPWLVVVGNAADTEVIVRGVPMDVSKNAREGVARFEVK